MPVTWMQLFRSAIDWDYLTEPQLGLNGRPIIGPEVGRWAVPRR